MIEIIKQSGIKSAKNHNYNCICVPIPSCIPYFGTNEGILHDDKLYRTKGKVRDIVYLHNLDYLLILFHNLNRIELRDTECNLIQTVDLVLEALNVKFWSNYSVFFEEQHDFDMEDCQNGHISDSISLATVICNKDDDSENEHEPTDKNLEIAEAGDVICCIGVIMKTELLLLKWINGKFHNKFSIKLGKVKTMEFLNSNKLICILNDGDVMCVTLDNADNSHVDKISNIKLTGTKSSFFWKDYFQILEIFKVDNELVLFNNDQLIKLNENLKIIGIEKLNFETKLVQSVKFWFPYILIIGVNSIELWNFNDQNQFNLIQSIQFKENIIQFAFNSKDFIVLTHSKIFKFVKLDYNYQLDQFENLKDYSNAISLIESLNPSVFQTTEDTAPKQLKFILLRKFQLLKSLSLIDSNFYHSMNLLTEYLAPPNLVISNLPDSLKASIDENKTDSESQLQINQLINYLTDTRRKLLRLMDNSKTTFQWHHYEIPLSVYYNNDPKFSISDNLKLIDDYLFNCYLITNSKMISPLLRIKNHCSFELVEKKCLVLKLFKPLTDFYFNRSKHEKSLELLDKLNDQNFLILYLNRLDNRHLELILKFSKRLIEIDENNFKLIFMNDFHKNLDSSNIVEFLKSNFHDSLLIDYLEWLIFKNNNSNKKFVDELLNLYLKDIHNNWKRILNLLDFGNYNATHLLKKLSNLEKSEKILRLMVEPLTKLGKYDDVLKILVIDLNDVRSSINYCLKIKENKSESLSKGLIFKILDLCLSKNDEFSIIEYILKNPSLDYLDFEEILNKLPNELSIKLLSPFLTMNLKKLNTDNKSSNIKSELLKIKIINLKVDKMGFEKTKKKLTSSSICVNCGKVFNRSEILCFYPSGEILHYGCSKSKLNNRI